MLGQCRESCGCAHSALFHLSPPNLHTTPSLPPPNPDRINTARYTLSHNLAQTPTHHTYPTSIPPNSTPASTLFQLTRPDPRPYPQPSVHYLTPDTPYPLPIRPTPTTQPNPSIPPYPLRIVSYPPNPHPRVYPFMPNPPQRLASVLAMRTYHLRGFAVS